MTPDSYLDAVARAKSENGLDGARIGVFRRYMDPDENHADVLARTDEALQDLVAAGAVTVDPFNIPDFEELTAGIWCNTFRHDVNAYLETLGPDAPVHTLSEVYATGLYAPYIKSRIERALAVEESPEERGCLDLYATERNALFRSAVVAAMDEAGVDAIVYPTWSWPARKIGDMESPAGDNSQILSPQTGLPAITVPTGFTSEGLPVGMTFIGRLFAEVDLIRLVYTYESATHHRRTPALFNSP